MTSPQAGQLSGAELAVLSNRFEAVVRAMRNTLVRSSRSGVVNIARDFSCSVVNVGNEVLHWAESLPIHVLSGPDLMTRSMIELHPRLQRGDAFLHNSPYHGGLHPADHTVLVPVIDDHGTHRFTVVAASHQADCGNAVATTYAAHARDVYEEGALIFPCVRAQTGYADNEDLIRMCRMRIRVPDQWWGDYLAVLGAARIGERRLLELGRELGWDALGGFAEQWLGYSERRMANAIARLPSGRATVTTAHDPIPQVPDGVPIKVTVDVDPGNEQVTVDLRDNLDCLPCGLNLSEATARAAAMVGVFNSIDHTVPPNGGSGRRVQVLLRENCVVGIPRHPASCSVATTNVFDRTANAVQRALAQLGDGMGMAEVGLSLPASVSVISGHDPRRGMPFMNQIILAWTGGAGTPHEDGWLTTGGVGDGGALLRDSVEVDEMKHPIIVWRQNILPDTEGAGRRRGAPGGLAEFGPHGCAIQASFLSDGTVNPPLGAHGGQPGGRASQFRRAVDGALKELPVYAQVMLEPGETLISYSTGGGGYGAPHEREPERVRHDVAEGWITPGRAAEVYGVAIDEAGHVDSERTSALRASLADRARSGQE
jgi:N-methylhydantoinase B